MVGNSPIGGVLSEQQVAQLCAAMVARVTAGRSPAARR